MHRQIISVPLSEAELRTARYLFEPTIFLPGTEYEWKRIHDWECRCCPRQVITKPGGFQDAAEREFFESQNYQEPETVAGQFANAADREYFENLAGGADPIEQPIGQPVTDCGRITARVSSGERSTTSRRAEVEPARQKTYRKCTNPNQCESPWLKQVIHLHYD